MKRWPRVSSPAAMPSMSNGTMSGSSVSGPKVASDRMQRPHPSEPPAAPAHRFRPGKCAHHLGDHLGQHLDRRPALLLGQRDVEVALLVGLHLGLIDRLQARRAQEPGDGLLGRADLGAFALFLHVGLPRRHAVHRQRQAARRDEGLGALIGEPRRHQPVGDELAQILGGARLHARGDFLRQEFEQKIGHGDQSCDCGVARRLPSKAAGRCHAWRRLSTSRPRRLHRRRRPSRRHRR